MIKVVDRVIVAFEGEGAGAGELSWGQRDIWLAMVRQESWLPNGAWGALPPGADLEEIAGRLRYMMMRFPTARTRLVLHEGRPPTQVVAGSGEIALDIVDAGDDDPAGVAEAMRLQYQDGEFDFVDDWPIRMAVIRRGDELTHLVVVMCHLVTDGFGASVLLEELEARTATPPPEQQSLEQARWQATPSGERQNAKALRHWEGILRDMPLRRYGDCPEGPQPRHWRGEFRSAALGPALRTITERTGIAPAPVLLAVFAVALARVTGVDPVVIRPMVNNRFRPGLDRVVCMLAQYGLCRLDVAGITFAEAFERAGRMALTTYKHAYYDPIRLDALIAAVAADRGPELQLPCYFNDRRGDRVYPPVPDAAPGEFVWTTRQDVPFEPLIVHIDDTPEGVQAIIFLDTHVVSPADGEALLRGLETVALQAAADPAASTVAGSG